MSLPSVPLPTATVDVAGTQVAIRGLSRSEACHLGTLTDDIDTAETYLIACATGLDESEVQTWRANTPANVADELVSAIADLSGLGPDAGKALNAG
jgi:hypothetical protein